ncbi:MAG: hypothetical protein FWH08_03760 [Oscillospiraceae bacterium]|nr:hypothetical protein [Oscillospiraceae bacterium]
MILFRYAVFLYDDELVVGFNWKDGTRTLKLSELEKTLGKRESVGSYLGQFGQETKNPLILYE